MDKLLIVCCGCDTQKGCKEDKIGGKRWTCFTCARWDRCWVDLLPVGTYPRKTSTICYTCRAKRKEEKDGKHLSSA